MSLDRSTAATVFLIGVLSLMFELVQVRMLAFFLGNNVDFLAIPIALLGLALGSMVRHYAYRGSDADLVRTGSIALLPLMLGSFLAFFWTANTFFPEIHVTAVEPSSEAVKVVVYSALFLPPYMLVGALFASLFSAFSDRIGRLYFYDLAGASLGCVIAPTLLTFADLPVVLTVLCALAAVLAALHGRTVVRAAAALTVVAVGGLASAELIFHEEPEPRILARSILRNYADRGIQEVDARWNEIARTALMRAGTGPGAVNAIVQDNGLSNVTVQGYAPDRFRPELRETLPHYSLPFHLGMEPRSILVMFAGMGRDMVLFDELTRGQADIVGVEINRTVVDWAAHPALANMRLEAFHAQPHIDLRNEEGRDFLNRDTRTYDLIYVANNGAVHASRTGHTRKFLDTYQAMGAYLDRLSPDGVILFAVQPIEFKLNAFAALFAERGLGDPREALFAYGDPKSPAVWSLAVKPSGFTAEQRHTLRTQVSTYGKTRVLYSADGPKRPGLKERVEDPPGTHRLLTDDRPFSLPVSVADFTLQPTRKELRDPWFVSSWIKVFTVLLFAIVAGVVGLAGLGLGRTEQRVPAAWVAYLLATGVGFMCVEIGLIAKTELFVGNPLYAVSVNLATFLVFNAIGAWLQDRYEVMSGPLVLAVTTVVAVAWGIGAVELLNATLLSAPLPLKVVGVAVAVFPAGVALGTFYPYCVTRLVRAHRPQAIPMTYGLTTLSSVLGSAFAMSAIINVGFSSVIALGAGCYLVAVGFAVIGGGAARGASA